MNQLHVHYVFPEFPVPSEAFARIEIKGLFDLGHRVSVSTFRPQRIGSSGLLEPHGLDTLEIADGSILRWVEGCVSILRRPVRSWRVLRTIIAGFFENPRETVLGVFVLPRAWGIGEAIIRSGDIDHVHLFWGHFPSLVGLSLKELGCSIPVSMFLGAYDLVRAFPPSRVLAKQVPITTHARANIPLICEFTGVEPAKITVIYRGVEVGEASSARTRSENPRIVVVERLTSGKRTLDCVKVFKRVLKQWPTSVLTIYGDGNQKGRLEQVIKSDNLQTNVRLCGHVPHEKVRRALNRAHVFLSMSQSPSERLPNALKEAMEAGCAVVVTSSPGIDELVTDGESGYIVPPGDVECAAERINVLLTEEQRLRSFGEEARKVILSSFDVSRTTRSRVDFWRRQVRQVADGA